MFSVSNNLTRGGAAAARRAHNPKVVGSNPTPATKGSNAREFSPGFFSVILFSSCNG